MDISICKRNKKVAISRWKKVHGIEEKYIKNNNIKHLKARILGYLAGDGNISIRLSDGKEQHHNVRFFPDHFSLISVLIEAFLKVYGKKPILKKEHNFYMLRVYSKPIVLDLLSYAKFGIHSWTLPNRLLTDKQSKQEWLRAFFDAEAYVGPSHIKLHSVNKGGLMAVKDMLLKEFRIASNMYVYHPKNPNYSTQHILLITKKEMKQRYLNEIGFNHKVKMNKLLNYLN